MLTSKGRQIYSTITEEGRFAVNNLTETGEYGETTPLVLYGVVVSGATLAFPEFKFSALPVATAQHDILSVFIDDPGNLRSEGGTIDYHHNPEYTTTTTTQDVFVADDGFMWFHDISIYTLKYGSLDKLPPLVLDSRLNVAGGISVNTEADLYLLPLGYLSSHSTLDVFGAASGELRYAANLRSEIPILTELDTGHGDFVDSWYVTKPKGYLYRLPYVDPEAKENYQEIRHLSLNETDEDNFRGLPWGEAKDQYYLSGYPWGTQEIIDQFLSSGAGQLPIKDHQPDIGWLELFPFDFDYTIALQRQLKPLDFWFKNPFVSLLQVFDDLMSFQWQPHEVFDDLMVFDWNDLIPTDDSRDIPWGGNVCYLISAIVNKLPEGDQLIINFVSALEKAPITEAKVFTLTLTDTGNFISGKLTEDGRYMSNVTSETGEYAIGDYLLQVSEGLPLSDRYYDLATALMVIDDQNLAVNDWIKKFKTVAAQPWTVGTGLWVKDTGTQWFANDYVGFYDPVAPVTEVLTEVEEYDGLVLEFDHKLRGIEWVKSVGCYQKTVDPYPGDPEPWVPVIIIDPLVIERSLNIMSTATLVRASDNAQIPVTSMSLDTDIGSWGWSFSAGIKTSAGLDMCKPTSADPVYVVATINGHSWKLVVEGYSERGTFGKTDYSITGRSLSAELASPLAEPGSNSYTQALNLSQIFDQELLRVQGVYDGEWTGVWAAQDGLIPANTYAYQDKTPIEVISELAASVGACVYHDLSTRVITVAPQYKKNPWSFIAGDEDFAIHNSTVISTGMTWKPSPVKNAVFVSGTTTNGYLCKVKRAGTAGDLIIPMVTDPLIVTNGIALERGRFEISKTGKKGDYSMELPLTTPGGGLELLTPSNVLSFTDLSGKWYGLLKGLSVEARLDNNAVVVRQQVTVERHFE